MSEKPQSATEPQAGVIARIVAAHRRGAARARDRSVDLSRAWSRALRHAAVPLKGLDLAVGEVSVTEGTPLARALDLLPEHGLVAALEDQGGHRGIVAISHGAVDALVEVQTTGFVEERDLPPRPVTRIDEALSRDFVDLALAAFSHETEGAADRDWPGRMSYGSGIADRTQLTLLLPEQPYHVLSADFRLGAGGRRAATATLVVPRISSGVAGAADAPQPEDWRAALEEELAQAPLCLEAVLLRTARPLHELHSLAPGDLIHFAASDLAEVRLEAPGGRCVFTGRLGQIEGQRALRLGVTPAGIGHVASAATPDDPAALSGVPPADDGGDMAQGYAGLPFDAAPGPEGDPAEGDAAVTPELPAADLPGMTAPGDAGAADPDAPLPEFPPATAPTTYLPGD